MFNIIRNKQRDLCVFVAISLLAGCDMFVSDESRLEQAQQHYEQGNHSAASIELKKILQNDQSNGQARVLLGRIALLTGQAATAEKEFRRAEKAGIARKEIIASLGMALLTQGRYEPLLEELQPADFQDSTLQAELEVIRGNAYTGMNQLTEAQKSFNAALALNSNALDALVGLARIAQFQNDYTKANEYVDQAIAIDDQYFKALFAKGEYLFREEKYVEAEDLFNKALDLQGKPITVSERFIAMSALAETQFRQGKLKETAVTVERLKGKYPKHPHPKYLTALLAYSNGDYQGAFEKLQETLKLAPNYMPAQVLMGAVNYALGNLEQADMFLSSVIAMNPASSQARKLLAATRLKLQQPNEAKLALLPALEGNEQDSQLLAMMGQAAIQSGDYESAIAYMEQGVKARPGNSQLQMELASTFLSQGQFDRAIETLEKITAEDGGLKRDALLIFAHLRKQDVDSAVTHTKKLLAENPNDANLHVLAGEVKLVANKLGEAEKHLKKALEIQPDNLLAYANLGRLHFGQKDLKSAEADFKKILEIQPDNMRAMQALAQIADANKQPELALEWLDKAIAADSTALKPRELALRYAFGKRDFAKAEIVARQALDHHPKNTSLISALSAALMGQEKNQEALLVFENAIKQQPNSAVLYHNLGRVHSTLKQYEQAKKAFKKSVSLEEGNYASKAGLAQLAAQTGDVEGALALARELQAENSESAAPFILEGDILMTQSRYTTAIKAYQAASEKQKSRDLVIKTHEAMRRANDPAAQEQLKAWLVKTPEDSGARLLLAQFYQNTGRNKIAIKEYETLLTQSPENFVALNNLAWLYHLANDERAINIAEKAHKLNPEDGSVTDTYGWILVERGQVKQGVDLLRKAARQSDIPDIQYHLAVGLEKLNELEEAKKVLTDLLNKDVDFVDKSEAKALLQRL